MQNAVQLIRNEEFDKIRIVIIDDEVWFVAVDVCKALKYKNSKDAVSKHVFPEDKMVINKKTLEKMASESKGRESRPLKFNSPRGLTVINEAGLYALIFGSKLPEAKNMKYWVFHEVLPQIRKYGYYKVDDSQYQLAPDEVEKDGLLFFRPTKKFKDRDSYYEAYAKKTAEWEEKYPDGDYEVAAITPEYNKEGKLMLNYHIGFNPNPKKTNEY